MSLSTVLDDSLESCIVVQTSLSTPWLPFVQSIIASSTATVICVCLLHPPEVVLPAQLQADMSRVKVVDRTGVVPYFENVKGIDSAEGDLHEAVLAAIADAPPGRVTLIVDSPDTLREDLASTAKAHAHLHAWHTALAARPEPTRTILPLPSPSPLLPRVLPPAFAPAAALAHLTLHPPALLRHLAAAHLAPAPPHPRFWALLAATPALWAGCAARELAVEVVVRRARRRVGRAVEGWPCALADLAELKGVWAGAHLNPGEGGAPADPTRDLSFNLVLTDAQQRARAQVPLPYAHAGGGGAQKDAGAVAVPVQGTIMYDPDSADDLDDDDPDEDLDI